jgi:hypothetical protein
VPELAEGLLALDRRRAHHRGQTVSGKLERIGSEALRETRTDARTDAFGIPGCVWTDTSLGIPPNITYKTYEDLGWALGQAGNRVFWGLADWLAYGEKRWPNRYLQAIEATGRSKGGLMNLASVARRVPRPRRRAELGFGHHAAVAKLKPKEQTRWLDIAVKERLSVEELRGRLKELPATPNSEIRTCPCCGSEVSPGTVIRDQHCPVHGRTSIAKRVAGLTYWECGCLDRGDA